MNTISTKQGRTYPRFAWTGGDTPTFEDQQKSEFRELRSAFFREELQDCGGLDLWKCAGTSCMDRARIFWNRATLDAWRTLNSEFRPLPPHYLTPKTKEGK